MKFSILYEVTLPCSNAVPSLSATAFFRTSLRKFYFYNIPLARKPEYCIFYLLDEPERGIGERFRVPFMLVGQEGYNVYENN